MFGVVFCFFRAAFWFFPRLFGSFSMVWPGLGKSPGKNQKAGRKKLISVKQKAQDRYNDLIHSALKDTVWLSGCKSWYIREDGRITTLYPYNGRTFRKQSKKVNFNDFLTVCTPGW